MIEFTIHPDSSVYLQEADRPSYGGARVVDAGTFRSQHPEIQLERGFILGLYHYQAPFTKESSNE